MYLVAIISVNSKQNWAFLFIQQQKHIILFGIVTSVFYKIFCLSDKVIRVSSGVVCWMNWSETS